MTLNVYELFQDEKCYDDDFYRFHITPFLASDEKERCWRVFGHTDTGIEWTFTVCHPFAVYNWKIKDQCFDNPVHATLYFYRLVCEYNTGIRVYNYAKQPVPDICGINGAGCLHPEGNTGLCTRCPIANRNFAQRDGIRKVVYNDTDFLIGNTNPISAGDIVCLKPNLQDYLCEISIMEYDTLQKTEQKTFVVAYVGEMNGKTYAVLSGVLFPVSVDILHKVGKGGTSFQSLMLWKDDFCSKERWDAVLKVLGLPEETTEVSLGATVNVAKP